MCNGNKLPRRSALSGKSTDSTALIGVLRLCAGNDRLDELPVRGFDVELRRVLRRGPRLHPVDDHRRAVLAGTEAQRHGYCRASQLDGQLRRGNRIPQYESEFHSCFAEVVGRGPLVSSVLTYRAMWCL